MGPPYVWEKTQAPRIPSTKQHLISTLHTFMDINRLKEMSVSELKYHFRQLVRGERHPGDCTLNMGSRNKDDLAQIVGGHGMHIAGSMTRGHLQHLLREHWHEQCELAKECYVPTQAGSSSEGGASWEVFPENDDGSDDLPESIADFNAAKDNLAVAFQKIKNHFGKNPKNQDIIDRATKSLENFVWATECLDLAALSSNSSHQEVWSAGVFCEPRVKTRILCALFKVEYC